jgi:hypothetical protein
MIRSQAAEVARLAKEVEMYGKEKDIKDLEEALREYHGMHPVESHEHEPHRPEREEEPGALETWEAEWRELRARWQWLGGGPGQRQQRGDRRNRPPQAPNPRPPRAR